MKFNTIALELPFSEQKKNIYIYLYLFIFLQTTYKCGLDQTWRGWIPRGFLAGQPESDLDSPALGSLCQHQLNWWETGQTLHLFARVKKRVASRVGACVLPGGAGATFALLPRTCRQPPRRTFSQRRKCAPISGEDREATLCVLIKLSDDREQSGADEGEGRRRRGRSARRAERTTRQAPLKERHCLLLSAPLIPVILFDGIRFINN